jgi:signal transduction histidine kinase
MNQNEAKNLNKKLLDIRAAMTKLNEKLVHDLRSPLTVITLQAELMKLEGALPAHAVEMCIRIVESGRKIDAILTEYLVTSSSI